MAILEILKMGDPRLLSPCEPVDDFESDEFKQLIQDLFETKEARGGVGLAAPQIGINKRIVVYGYRDGTRYPDAPDIADNVLINPTLTPIGEETDQEWEGCLSLPGMRGFVTRYTNIHYQGVNQTGEPIEGEVDGFFARMLQHECDHLDGILYPMRLSDIRLFGYEDALISGIQHASTDDKKSD